MPICSGTLINAPAPTCPSMLKSATYSTGAPLTLTEDKPLLMDACGAIYYARFMLRRTPEKAARAKVVFDDVVEAAASLDTLLRFSSIAIVFDIADPSLPRGHPRSSKRVLKSLQRLGRARKCLDHLKEVAEEAKRDVSGRPAHYWRIGFTTEWAVFGIQSLRSTQAN